MNGHLDALCNSPSSLGSFCRIQTSTGDSADGRRPRTVLARALPRIEQLSWLSRKSEVREQSTSERRFVSTVVQD